MPITIRIAQQVVLEPYTKHSVLATTSTSGIHTVKPGALGKSMKLLFNACGVKDTVPSQPFRILLSNVSAKAMHPLEELVVAYAASLPTAQMTLESSLH